MCDYDDSECIFQSDIVLTRMISAKSVEKIIKELKIS